MKQSHVRILVVDDERNIRNNLTMVLEAAGYKVDASGDGEDALTKCKTRHYDIAFVDIQMPKMGGLELLRYLHTLRPRMAVVILTAYGSTGRAVEAMKLGAVDFLEKPFDPNNIQLLCEEIFQRQKTGASVTMEDLLRMAELARERKAYIEARVYLKTAMMRESRDQNLITGLVKFPSLRATSEELSNTIRWHWTQAPNTSQRLRRSSASSIPTQQRLGQPEHNLYAAGRYRTRHDPTQLKF
jgi:DNA-binding response OmpR family regulator